MKRVVLAGAGHAHLYALKRTAAFLSHGIHVTLIAPEAFWYSGLATGMLGGKYPAEQDQIDVAALVAQGGGDVICGRVAAVDPRQKCVRLESGDSVAYDVLSLDLGSAPPPIPGAHDRVYAVKPISSLWRLRCDLKNLSAARAGSPVRIAVIGGGTSACEIAANLAALGKLAGAAVEISLLTRGLQVLAKAPPRAGVIISQVLAAIGVKVVTSAHVRAFEADAAVTEDERRFGFDLAVNATGLAPSPVMQSTGLPVDAHGALIVDAFLRSTGDDFVFGGGDCIAFAGRQLPRLGVYAVREAPVLFRNLIAAAEGRPLEAYRPQKHALAILNLGDGTGLAIRGGLALRGRMFEWLKDRIDRKFLAGYRTG